MNAEIIDIFERSLNEPTEKEVEALTVEAQHILNDMIHDEQKMRDNERRLNAIRDELGELLGDDLGGVDPLLHATRAYFSRKDSERKARALAIIERHRVAGADISSR